MGKLANFPLGKLANSPCAVTKVSLIFLVPRLAHGSQYNVVDMLVFVQLPLWNRRKRCIVDP